MNTGVLMKMNTWVVLLGGMAIMAAACRKDSTLTYRIKNIASDSVDVICTRADMPGIYDTMWIGYNQEVILAVTTEGSEHISNYKETAGTLRNLTRVDVYKRHGHAKTTTNFLNSSLWIYDERSSSAANYTTTITDKDFQ
jgi:hypothetical protein